MTRILAVDTTVRHCSVALLDGGRILAEQQDAPRRHTELLLPMVDRLLAAAGLVPTRLDAIAFGLGPGSFTGLRIALGVAQGIALACDLPLLGVSSLATMAQGIMAERPDEDEFCCALDARMGEVYWGRYRRTAEGVATALCEDQILSPSGVSLPAHDRWLALGAGWGVAGMPRPHRELRDWEPLARYMLPLAARDWQLGRAVDPAVAAPVYLRNQVATPSGHQH